MRLATSGLLALGLLAAALSLPAPQAVAAQRRVQPNAAFVDKWLGNFRFEEAVAGTAFTYEVALISGRDGAFVGDVYVKGRQTNLSLHCEVVAKVADNALDFVFHSHTQPPVPGSGVYKPGDRLFTLREQRGKLSTQWHQMKPQLPPSAWGSQGFVRLDHGRPKSATKRPWRLRSGAPA